MNYVRRTLAADEQVRFRAHLHWILWLRAFAALIILGIFVIGIVMFVRDLINLTNTEVVLTNRRLILKTGLFDRHATELELSSVEAVNLDQSFWGRLLDFGHVQVHGTGDDSWSTPLIANPIAFRREIQSALSVAASHHGGAGQAATGAQ